MKLRLLIVSCLIAPLTGCVSLGATDLLVTPIAVFGVHSFAPPSRATEDTDSAVSEPTVNADNNQHTRDENLRIGNFITGTETI